MKWRRIIPLKLVKSKFRALDFPKFDSQGNKLTEFNVEIEGKKFVIRNCERKFKIFYPSELEVKKI